MPLPISSTANAHEGSSLPRQIREHGAVVLRAKADLHALHVTRRKINVVLHRRVEAKDVVSAYVHASAVMHLANSNKGVKVGSTCGCPHLFPRCHSDSASTADSQQPTVAMPARREPWRPCCKNLTNGSGLTWIIFSKDLFQVDGILLECRLRQVNGVPSGRQPMLWT